MVIEITIPNGGVRRKEIQCASNLGVLNYVFEQGFELVHIGYPRFVALFRNKAVIN